MNVNSLITKDYRKNDDFAVQKNKPNSNPILSAVGGLLMNVNLYVIEDYENETAFRLEQNKPKQTQFQMPTNPSKERRKGYHELFLALSCRKGYNIVLSLAFVYLLPPRVYFGV